MIYHLIKDHAREINTKSLGERFLVEPKDVPHETELVISVDIKLSPQLPLKQCILIDHHPEEDVESKYLFSVFDPTCKSCSLLIFDALVADKDNPYFVFLSMLGYFGDGGSKDDIPGILHDKALQHMPQLMKEKASYYSNGTYLEIEKFVSTLNIGKRMHWNGDIPLALLKEITTPDALVFNLHPLCSELLAYKRYLSSLYSQPVEFTELEHLHYSVIDCEQNIQGVLAAKHANGKPIIVMNTRRGEIKGSMRVPEGIDFDAGSYLAQFSETIPSFIGGGHEKAGGFSFDAHHKEEFLKMLHETTDWGKNNNAFQ